MLLVSPSILLSLVTKGHAFAKSPQNQLFHVVIKYMAFVIMELSAWHSEMNEISIFALLRRNQGSER